MSTYPCTIGELSPTDGAAAFAGTPTIAYGTAYADGTATTLLRSDATLLNPSTVMTNNDTTKSFTMVSDGAAAERMNLSGWQRLELWGDGNAGTSLGIQAMGAAGNKAMALGTGTGVITTAERATVVITGSVGVGADIGLDFQLADAGESGDFCFSSLEAPNTTTNSVVSVLLDPSQAANQNTALSAFTSISTNLTGRTIRAYDNNFLSLTGVFTGTCKFVGYGMSVANLTSQNGSSATLSAYGTEMRAFTIGGGSLGTFTESAAFIALSGTGTNVTLGLGGKIELPRASTTTQVGLDFVNVSGGSAPTDRMALRVGALTRGTNRYVLDALADSTGTPTNNYGTFIDNRTVGTNRWSHWGYNKFHCDTSDFIANASGKGFSNRDSQSSSAGGGGTARYWRMFVDASATGVAGDVTLIIDSLGNVSATRAGGATGTVLLKMVDVGTAAATT